MTLLLSFDIIWSVCHPCFVCLAAVICAHMARETIRYMPPYKLCIGGEAAKHEILLDNQSVNFPCLSLRLANWRPPKEVNWQFVSAVLLGPLLQWSRHTACPQSALDRKGSSGKALKDFSRGKA